MGEGIILSFSFCGQLANYYSHVFSLIHPLDEFSFQEMRTWVQSKFSYCCLSVWCKSRELGGRGESKIPNTKDGNLCILSTSYKMSLGRVAFGIIYITSSKSWGGRGASHQPAFMVSCLTIRHTRLACLPSR